MKKFSLFISIITMICLTNIGFSQKCKCKVAADPFSNDSVFYFECGSYKLYELTKEGGITLVNSDSYNGELKVQIPKGSEILLKLEDGQILNFTAEIDVTPATSVFSTSSSTRVWSTYTYLLTLSKTDLEKLANSPVSLIRYPNPNGGTKDVAPTSKKWLKNMVNGAKCILLHLQ